MNEDLNSFLEPAKPEEERPPEPQVQEAVTEVQAEPEAPAEPEAVEAPAEPAAPANGRMVPLAALEAERTKRQEFERQLEAFRKQQQAPQAPAPDPTWVNPAEDPAGYHARIQEMMINQHLNTSEMQARKLHGAEKVAEAASEFKQAMEENPSLRSQLYQQLDPYDWMMKEVEAIRLRKEIGEDPTAYRARIRAEIEAEMAGNAVAPQVPTQAAPVLPSMAPSLARARSAAPRSAPAFTGTPHVNDVFADR